MEDHEPETTALIHVLEGRKVFAQAHLNDLSFDELNHFSDALDELAAIVDDEAIRRAEKRR